MQVERLHTEVLGGPSQDGEGGGVGAWVEVGEGDGMGAWVGEGDTLSSDSTSASSSLAFSTLGAAHFSAPVPVRMLRITPHTKTQLKIMINLLGPFFVLALPVSTSKSSVVLASPVSTSKICIRRGEPLNCN